MYLSSLLLCPALWSLPWQPPLLDFCPPRGRYVEARTASVYAGACHYGAEATTQGREAVVAWHFEGGAHDGVALAGIDVAAAIKGDDNLATPDVDRHSLVYVSNASSAPARAAAVDLIRSTYAELLGEVRTVEPVELQLDFDADAYELAAPERFNVTGQLLADRACCKMPYDRWYAPLCEIDDPLVGCNSTFAFTDKRLGALWTRADENTTLSGSFTIALRKESN